MAGPQPHGAALNHDESGLPRAWSVAGEPSLSLSNAVPPQSKIRSAEELVPASLSHFDAIRSLVSIGDSLAG